GSPAERAAALAALLEALPARLEHARRNLRHPPARFTQEAIFQAEGVLGALGERVPAMVREGGPAGGELERTADRAMEALEAYLGFLRDELLPASDGSFVLGEDDYNYIVRERWFLGEDADALLARGRKAFAETGRLAQQVAERIDPGRHWIEVYEDLKDDHPRAEDLKAEYQEQIDA